MEVVLDPELVAQSLDVLVCNGRFDPRLEVQERLSFGALTLYARIFPKGQIQILKEDVGCCVVSKH